MTIFNLMMNGWKAKFSEKNKYLMLAPDEYLVIGPDEYLVI